MNLLRIATSKEEVGRIKELYLMVANNHDTRERTYMVCNNATLFIVSIPVKRITGI